MFNFGAAGLDFLFIWVQLVFLCLGSLPPFKSKEQEKIPTYMHFM